MEQHNNYVIECTTVIGWRWNVSFSKKSEIIVETQRTEDEDEDEKQHTATATTTQYGAVYLRLENV